MSLSLSWLWQFNFFLWEIGFLSEVGESFGGVRRRFWTKEKKGKSRVVENFSHSYKLFTRVVSKIPCLHSPSSLHAWVKAWYRRPHIIQADDNIATTTSSVRHGSYWPKISTVLYEPQLSELHTMLWMWSIELRKFNATNFSHVFLYYSFLVPRISWWRICAVRVNPTVCVEWEKVYLQHGFLFLFWIIFLN